MNALRKYPRTKHCPWSQTKSNDDKEHASMEQFIGRRVVVTEKMDGENTTMYSDHYHARSLDSKNHPSRNAVKQIWGNIRYLIPRNWRICGENLYAKHSIEYTNLEGYFYGFSVWNEHNIALDWDATQAFLALCGLPSVPVLYVGTYDEIIIKSLWNETKRDVMEGYVIRVVDEIPYDDFGTYVAKFVRSSHVQSSEHWMNQQIIPNKLKR